MEIDGKWVRKLRKELGMTQAKFAKIYGISLASIMRWEQGYGNPGKSMRNYLMVISEEPWLVIKLICKNWSKQKPPV